LRKSKALGYSVYVSTWDSIKDQLSSLYSEGSFIFTSLHIEEEIQQPQYQIKALEMLKELKRIGFRIIADVSPRTLEALEVSDFESLVQQTQLDVLRADFGFSFEELVKMGQYVDVCVNASMDEEGIVELQSRITHSLMAMHNFYPRPETGLDFDQLIEKNQLFIKHGIPLAAFIPSDGLKRGPIFEGLPTCESHRTTAPLVGCIDLISAGIDRIVVGDGVLTSTQNQMCLTYINEGIVSIDCTFEGSTQCDLSSVMTIRSDSPKQVLRLLESRLYATPGQKISPQHTVSRHRGSITLDNENYLRYSGEVQILKKDLEADDRVNVIGQVNDLDLLDRCQPGMKIKLLKENQ